MISQTEKTINEGAGRQDLALLQAFGLCVSLCGLANVLNERWQTYFIFSLFIN
jgi:hypothetical protein